MYQLHQSQVCYAIVLTQVDWMLKFRGNSDDCFRFGISFNKNQARIYADYYDSDIIIASPLGLRLSIEEESIFTQLY